MLYVYFQNEQYVYMKLFVDDVKLYSSVDNVSGDLQTVCDKLKTWADKRPMRIGFSKSPAQRISECRL